MKIENPSLQYIYMTTTKSHVSFQQHFFTFVLQSLYILKSSVALEYISIPAWKKIISSYMELKLRFNACKRMCKKSILLVVVLIKGYKL